jgi:hypothetical protein
MEESVNISFKQRENKIWTYWEMEVILDLAISTIVGRPSATWTRPPAIKNTRHVFSTAFSIFNFSSSSPFLLSRMSKTFKGVEGFAFRPYNKVGGYFSKLSTKMGLSLLGSHVNQTRGPLLSKVYAWTGGWVAWALVTSKNENRFIFFFSLRTKIHKKRKVKEK